VNEMSSAGGDLDRYVSADIAFHLGLAQAAGNSILAGIIANIESLLRAWALRVLRTAGETQTSLAMHKPILDAVKNADGEAAQIAMAAHSDRAARRLRASLVPQGTMPKTQRKVPSRAPSLRRSPRTP
jgi:GntR family transcriptional repressor for pyruvate dehydrogenase complex